MNHNNICNKELILRLIKDDLLSTRLILGLEALGLNAGKYYLHLSETIFLLMEIKDEALYEQYIEESKEVMRIDAFKQPEQLEGLALKLYRILEKKARLGRD